MRINTNKFFWSPASGLFSQDVSSLTRGPTENVFHRLYEDACDQGITLISDKTGQEAVYFVDSVDEEYGEIQGWNLLPTPETVRKLPRLKNTRVLIGND